MRALREMNLNIVVVGLGLIGGSYAKAIKKYIKVKNLWAIDINKKVLDEAEKIGVIDKGFVDPKFPLSNADVVILCIYPNITVKFVKDNIKSFKKSCIITDTAGIKVGIIKEINGFLREDLDFIGGHPMAGRECQGFAFASEEVFYNAQYILVPNGKNKIENIELLKEIIREIKFKSILEMDAEKHDEIVAFTSQLPHIIACTLMNNSLISENFQCIGGSFKDATRVAKINCDLWVELFMENKSYIVDQLRHFIDHMNYMTELIENDKSKELMRILSKVSELRKEMDI